MDLRQGPIGSVVILTSFQEAIDFCFLVFGRKELAIVGLEDRCDVVAFEGLRHQRLSLDTLSL